MIDLIQEKSSGFQGMEKAGVAFLIACYGKFSMDGLVTTNPGTATMGLRVVKPQAQM